jgi:hypothetical protein
MPYPCRGSSNRNWGKFCLVQTSNPNCPPCDSLSLSLSFSVAYYSPLDVFLVAFVLMFSYDVRMRRIGGWFAGVQVWLGYDVELLGGYVDEGLR